MLKEILLVGIGGAVGAVCRFLTGFIFVNLLKNSILSVTVFINIIGSFCIGGLMTVIDNYNLRLFLIVGYLGGFTTFSSFAYENFVLLQSDNIGWLVINVGVSVLLSLLAVYLGVKLFG